MISFAVLILLVVLLVLGAGGALWYIWSSNLPYIGSVKEYTPPTITEIYSDEGEVIGKFWEEKRIVTPLDHFPKHLVNAFIAAEDARFYQHEGVDFGGILRAFFRNIAARRIEQGGSTITQQVVKALLLKNPEKTYKRKVREATLSLQIEKEFTKEHILFLYLNEIYLGQGAYGVEAAAQTYFNKSASDLSLAESAILAGLTQAPSRYSIFRNFDKAKNRQKYVLERMRQEGLINAPEEQEALASEIVLAKEIENPFDKAPDFSEHVRRSLESKYGRTMFYTEGLKVYTTVNLSMQKAAESALKEGLLELDKREGYRGPLRHLAAEDRESYRRERADALQGKTLEIGDVVEGLVEKVDEAKKRVSIFLGQGEGIMPLSEMKWARKPNPNVAFNTVSIKNPGQVLKAGDVVLVRIKEAGPRWRLSLEQEPLVQGALICLESATGRVKAMVGGRDFRASQFNRAVQSRRQPGSAFKPIIYTAALDWGMTPATVLLDAPYVSSMNPDEDIWRPKNFKEKFLGPTLLRTALVQSRNVITVKILKQIGVPYAISYARNMGVKSELSADLSLALGSSGVSLAELTCAYAVFANGGMLTEPIYIDRVTDLKGRILEENRPVLKQCISKETAYVITDILKAVIQEGTGWRAKALKRPAAGKTGTTNDSRDAWFIGFTNRLTAGVWVGYDDNKPLGAGETGSRAANPIWLYFMNEVLKGEPVEDFPVPEKVAFWKIDAKTGLLASPYSEATVSQAFAAGQEPKEYQPKPQAAKAGQFSQFDLESMEEEDQ
ncbi:MAG: PBP1A family penicillin-binding protein [Deltaproteobacteria bacterium]|nr:PBP1A family penicillin-binding protein [Deltaproteobacteria bacterium]